MNWVPLDDRRKSELESVSSSFRGSIVDHRNVVLSIDDEYFIICSMHDVADNYLWSMNLMRNTRDGYDVVAAVGYSPASLRLCEYLQLTDSHISMFRYAMRDVGLDIGSLASSVDSLVGKLEQSSHSTVEGGFVKVSPQFSSFFRQTTNMVIDRLRTFDVDEEHGYHLPWNDFRKGLEKIVRGYAQRTHQDDLGKWLALQEDVRELYVETHWALNEQHLVNSMISNKKRLKRDEEF